MNKKNINHLLLLIGLTLLIPVTSFSSDKLVVPEEELNRDVVLPRFDKRVTYKNPNVVFENRFELGVFFGSNFTEPIYNPAKFGIELGYHSSDDSSWQGSFSQWGGGFNPQYVPSIENQGDLTGSTGDYDFNRGPQAKSSLWAYYNKKAYYGKISVAKKKTMNLSLYTQYGLGLAQFTNKTYLGGAVGIGQKFYLSNNFGIKAELRLQLQGQPNPFLGDGLLKIDSPTKPDSSAFSDVYRFATIFEVGALWMF